MVPRVLLVLRLNEEQVRASPPRERGKEPWYTSQVHRVMGPAGLELSRSRAGGDKKAPFQKQG